MSAVTSQLSPISLLSPSPTVTAEDGYIKLSFPGKNDQLLQVSQYIREQNMIPDMLIEQEVDWFYK
jgi:glutamate dehydrogenase